MLEDDIVVSGSPGKWISGSLWIPDMRKPYIKNKKFAAHDMLKTYNKVPWHSFCFFFGDLSFSKSTSQER